MRAPTHKEYLLDLILSDLEALSNVEVLAPIADHSLVQMVVDINTVSSEASKRDVWVFKLAKWQPLKTELGEIKWDEVFGSDFSANAATLTDLILKYAKIHIPVKSFIFRKRSHPWLADTAIAAIEAKTRACGTDGFDELAAACAKVLAG